MRLKLYFVAGARFWLPMVVVGELRAGFAAGSRQAENEHLLRRFMDNPGVELLTLGDETTKVYAAVYKGLRQAGKPIGTNGMWIAAIALEHKLPVLTLDADFSYIDGLELIKL